ncbi:MAG TPA: glycosyltransferase family 4 protein [Acidimicrobiia bacterium]|nr:glycosyltransferase family 4 protein [Acidimicrobiia bacterium]
MRIALVHPYPWPEVRRGAERYLDDLSWYLASRGHDVEVVTGTHDRPRTERTDDGVTIRYRRHLWAGRGERLGVTPIETFGVAALPPLLERRAEVVHAFTPSGALAGRLSGRPTVFTVLGHPDVEQLPSARVPWLLWRAAVRAANVTATLSAASAEALDETMGRRGVVLSPGVRLERFAPDLAPRTGAPRLLFAGSLADRRKRADLAVAAFGRVLERHPDARLTLSGEGDGSWALAATRSERVRRAVDVVGAGRPADLPAQYRAATVTVLPAEHEAFGLVLVESLACGTPVVCVASGGMPEIVGDEGAGVVASAATPDAVADAAERAIAMAAEPSTATTCVARARQWGWQETIGPAHEAIYEQLVATRAVIEHVPALTGGRRDVVGPPWSASPTSATIAMVPGGLRRRSVS